MFDACDDLNCNPTCLSGFLPGTRDESDSLLVWLMVLSTLTAALLVLAAGDLKSFERAARFYSCAPQLMCFDVPCKA